MKKSTVLLVATALLTSLPAHADYLQAGVSMSEGDFKAPKPVPDGFREGEKFEESSIDNLKKSDTWTQIPSWLAGYWKTNETTVDAEGDGLAPMKSNYITQFGYVCVEDREGNFWTPLRLPSRGIGESDHVIDYSLFSEISPLESNPKKLKLFRTCITLSINKRTGLISTTRQVVGTIEFTQGDNGTVRAKMNSKSFDQSGNALGLQYQSTMIFSLAHPLTPTDYDEKNFLEYLKANGLISLMPTTRFTGDDVQKMAEETGIKFAPSKEALLKQLKHSKSK